ncbi:hypothetical protein [Gorillibacterium sp. sgz500922]|uniref:hypothetical protein n=1 Tax=Gorillibacterium sp. sgz500922 TaxID=3446694 RepID=UPI003F667B58
MVEESGFNGEQGEQRRNNGMGPRGWTWRRWLLVLAGALILAAVVWSIPRFGDPVFHVDGAKYRYAGTSGGGELYRTKGQGEPITIRHDGKRTEIHIGQEAFQVQRMDAVEGADQYEVTDSIGTRVAKELSGLVLVRQENGEFVPEFIGYAVTSNGERIYSDPQEHPVPAGTLVQIADPTLWTKDGQVGYYLLGVFLLAVSWLRCRFVEFFFRLEYGLWVEDPEPTDFYLLVNRVGSIAFAVVGVCCLLGGVLSVT